MTDYGVTSTGFTVKPLEVILEEIEADVLEGIDASLDTSPTEPLGQLLGIFAKHLAANWELLATAYGSIDRSQAEFFLLDSIGALTGCTRLAAQYSTVRITCTLTNGTTITEGVAKVNPTSRPTDIWVAAETVTADADGDFAVLFRADTLGARVANAETLTVITAPVSGWSVATNLASADVGRLEESDVDYRARQLVELYQAGSSTVTAIRAALLTQAMQDLGMLEAKVFENETDATDANGLPPHSMRAVIWDGVSEAVPNDDIAQVLWDNKGGGIGFGGDVTGDAVDSDGNTRTIAFARADQQNVYLDLTLTTESPFSAAQFTAVKDAIVAKGRSTLKIGTDVIALTLRAACFTVPGVLDVPTFKLKIGSAPGPGDTSNLTIDDTSIALVDAARITVA